MSVRLDIRCPLGLFDALEGYAMRETGGDLSRAARHLLREGLREEGIEVHEEAPQRAEKKPRAARTLPLPKGDQE